MSSGAFLGAAVDAWWRDRHGSPERVLQTQRRRLARLIAHAQQQVPLYRNLYAGIDPRRFDLQTLPVVDKAMVQDRFADTLAGDAVGLDEVHSFGAHAASGALLHDRWMLFHTSGTTGRIGYFLVDQRSWARQVGVLFARVMRDRLTLGNILRFGPWRRFRVAHLVATGGPYVSFLFSTFRTALTGLVARQVALSISAPRDETLRVLEAYQPHYLHGYASSVDALAREQLAGGLHIAPDVISLGSESVTPWMRSTLERAFPATEIRETYGATECPVMANQCREGSLHINSDACLLEAVDAEGRAVPPGQVSTRVLLTNLLNYGQPLIRYELSDQIIVAPEPCRCGSPFPAVRVIGRTDDTLTLRREDGGVEICPPIPFELLFLDLRGLAQYQLLHEVQNQLQVRAVLEQGVDVAAVTQVLLQRFEAWKHDRGLAASVVVDLEIVDAIPRDPRSHKVRQIISRVPSLDPPPTGARAIAMGHQERAGGRS
ncbi:MAG: phenylacetate--CoA ligase family protein [Pseudomonadota bacterium]